MKRKTIEEIKQIVKEKSNGECELISTEYKNSNSPIVLRCKCGNVFETKYACFDKISFTCKDCRNKIASKKYRHNIEYVIDFINRTGCEYLCGEYENSNSVLTIRCRCGTIFKKSFNKFQRGQQQCPACGKEASRKSKFKYDLESVRDILQNKGYTLLETKYDNCVTPMRCLCKKGHETYIILSQFLNGCSGCKKCQYELLRTKNQKEEKSSDTEVLKDLRDCIKSWKIEIAKKYGYRCYLTDSNRDFVVHHLYPFKKIVEDSCSELGLTLCKNFGDYTFDQYNKLKNLVISKHTTEIGILLQRKVHIKFHSIYGVCDTTIEQFNEFIQKYYPKKDLILLKK